MQLQACRKFIAASPSAAVAFRERKLCQLRRAVPRNRGIHEGPSRCGALTATLESAGYNRVACGVVHSHPELLDTRWLLMQQAELGVWSSKPIARRDVVQQSCFLQQRTPTACSRLSLRYAGISCTILGAHGLIIRCHVH